MPRNPRCEVEASAAWSILAASRNRRQEFPAHFPSSLLEGPMAGNNLICEGRANELAAYPLGQNTHFGQTDSESGPGPGTRSTVPRPAPRDGGSGLPRKVRSLSWLP
jgi:hypothetical protein